MGSPEKTQPEGQAAANAGLRFVRAWYGRGEATWKRLSFRLKRPVPAGTPRVWTPRLLELAVAAVVAILFIAIFDSYFRPFAAPPANAALRFLRAITDAAKSGWYIVPAVIVITIIGSMDWRALRTASRRALLTAYGRAAYILAAIAVPGITVNLIKQLVGRARPRMAEELGVYAFSPFHFDYAFQSFPSGHAATAGSLAVILMLWHPQAKWPLFFAMFALACGRIPAGAHYPSDVVAGFSIGAIMALAIARWLARRRAVFTLEGNRTLPRLNP